MCQCDESGTCFDKVLAEYTAGQAEAAYSRMKQAAGWDNGWTFDEFRVFINESMRENSMSTSDHILYQKMLDALTDEDSHGL